MTFLQQVNVRTQISHLPGKTAAWLKQTKKSVGTKVERSGAKVMRGATRSMRRPAQKLALGKGLTTRRKNGNSVSSSQRGRLPTGQQANRLINQVNLMRSFDVIPKLPYDKRVLTRNQFLKAREQLDTLQEELNQLQENYQQQNQQPGEAARMTEVIELIHGLNEIITLAEVRSATRQEFSRSGWQALDHVNFALVQRHLNNLQDVFLSRLEEGNQHDWQSNLGLNRKESLVAEALAKGLAYIEDLDGKHINIPIVNDEGTTRMVQYTISLMTIGENLPIYILRSRDDNAPNIAVPRGTETITGKTRVARGQKIENRQAAKESIMADLDPTGIAYGALATSVDALRAELNRDGEKGWIIAGHSLGGLLSTEMAVRNPTVIKKSYGFNSPGVCRETEERYHRLIDDSQEMEEKFITFAPDGDLVPAAGRVIGKWFAVHSTAGDPLHAHLQHDLVKPGVKVESIDVEQENAKLSRRFAEGTRRTVGGAAYKIRGVQSALSIANLRRILYTQAG